MSRRSVPTVAQELELLPRSVVVENAFISCPVKLEQYLSEGAYDKIVLSQHNLPCPHYDVFVHILLDTVRSLSLCLWMCL